MIFNLKQKNLQKGFTLFTALVSLLLISITLILIFNMIQTEETYLTLINDQSSLSDLVTIADLSRADAYNTFIVSLRYLWEENYSNPENSFLLSRDLIDLEWNSFVQNIANDKFFSRDFAGVFAQTLLNNLKYTLHPTGYNVDISVANGTYYDAAGNVIAELTEENNNDIFKQIIRQLFDDGGNRVDVVNCEKNSEAECTGSFYLTLDARQLSDPNYELLPRVTVLRLKNNEVIERPVLGRQIYKIYMPWRGFQAYRIARRIAHDYDCEISDTPAFCNDDEGLFNAEFHNILEQARLGVCEPNSCGYRTNLFKTASQNGFEDACSANFPVPVANQNLINDYDFGLSNINGYSSQNSDSYDLVFEDLINTFVENKLVSRTDTIVFNNSLNMSGETYNNVDLNIFSVDVEVLSQRTKQTLSRIDDSGSVGNIDPVSFSLNSSGINGLAGGLGLFKSDDFNYGVRPYLIFPNWDSYYSNTVQGDNVLFIGSDDSESSANLSCYELGYYSINLSFVEDNPRYLVDTGRDARINIKLVDNFVSYKFPHSTPYSLNFDTQGYLTGTLPDNVNVNENEWICKTIREVGPDQKCIPN